MAYYEDVKTSTIAYVGLVSALAVFIIVLVVQVLYYRYRNQQAVPDGYSVSTPAELTDLIGRQQTQLTVPRVVDKGKSIVTISISRAMELVVSELASGKSPHDVIGPSRAAQKVQPASKANEPSKNEEGKEADDDQRS